MRMATWRRNWEEALTRYPQGRPDSSGRDTRFDVTVKSTGFLQPFCAKINDMNKHPPSAWFLLVLIGWLNLTARAADESIPPASPDMTAPRRQTRRSRESPDRSPIRHF